MKLKNAFLTSLMIIILLFSSLCFFLFTLGRSFLSYDYLHNISINFDFIKYIKDNEILKESLDKKEIPLDVFNYIDNNSIKSIIDEYLNNFYYEDKNYLNKNNIREAIYSSVKIYENKNTVEVLKFIDNDIDEFVSRIEYSLKDKVYLEGFSSIRKIIFNDFYFYSCIFLFIISIIMLIILEKKTSIIIIGGIFLLFSLLLYLFVNFLDFDVVFSFLGMDISGYFHLDNILFIDEKYQIFYVSLFVLGIIFVIIYILLSIKFLLKKLRILYYDNIYK